MNFSLQASRRYRARGRVSTWLFSIAAKLVRDQWRRRSRRGEAVARDDLALIAPDRIEEAALQALGTQHLRAALLRLPLEQRSALVLRYDHDLSCEEVAEALSCPLGTVRSTVRDCCDSFLSAEVTRA